MTVLITAIDLQDDELIISWSNDRHQLVKLHGREPMKVISTLEEVLNLLKEEQASGYLDVSRDEL